MLITVQNQLVILLLAAMYVKLVVCCRKSSNYIVQLFDEKCSKMASMSTKFSKFSLWGGGGHSPRTS